MGVHSGDAEAMHLYQLIGAPLLAVVQAEAQAAQTSADFIKRVGFTGDSADDPTKDLLQHGGNIGDLKMAEFTLQRPDVTGKVQPVDVKIPVLSLFPVPLLQIKDAEFTFAIRILTRVPLQSSDEEDKQLAPMAN